MTTYTIINISLHGLKANIKRDVARTASFSITFTQTRLKASEKESFGYAYKTVIHVKHHQ